MNQILVMEDEVEIRANIREILELESFPVITAETGEIGLQWAKEHVPDLIICDIVMPGLDGYEIARALRQDPITCSIPFIFLTAKADRSDLRQGMQLGADDYLTKPFDPMELLRAIATCLEKKATLEQQTQAKLDELCDRISLSLSRELLTSLDHIQESSKLLIEKASLIGEKELEMVGNIHVSAQLLHRLTQNCLFYKECISTI